MNTPGTTVAKAKPPLPADVQMHIDANRQKNAIVAAIRGTIWSKDLNETQVRAVAQYARETGIDPVRHIEVLGGRIYLTADFYAERGAPLLRAGKVVLHETEYINVDPRLETLAKQDNAAGKWAETEIAHRQMQRIKYCAPEKSLAIAVVRITIPQTGATFVGVNWCGGNGRRDPVGDAEPTKTAETRAARRAWRKIVTVLPELETAVANIEARARMVEGEFVEAAIDTPKALPKTTQIEQGEHPTMEGVTFTPRGQASDDLFPLEEPS